MTPVVIDAFGDLADAMENLCEAESSGEAVSTAVEQLSAAIDAAVAALKVPTPLDADQVAGHNALVSEVNAAIDRYNRAVHVAAAVGAWCQFCGLTIEAGADVVPTAEIPEENIQMYAHRTCWDAVMGEPGDTPTTETDHG